MLPFDRSPAYCLASQDLEQQRWPLRRTLREHVAAEGTEYQQVVPRFDSRHGHVSGDRADPAADLQVDDRRPQRLPLASVGGDGIGWCDGCCL